MVTKNAVFMRSVAFRKRLTKIFMRGGPSIMATTRIMPLHVGKGRTESWTTSDIIDYVVNPQKTDEYSGQQVYTVRLLGNRLEIM